MTKTFLLTDPGYILNIDNKSLMTKDAKTLKKEIQSQLINISPTSDKPVIIKFNHQSIEVNADTKILNDVYNINSQTGFLIVIQITNDLKNYFKNHTITGYASNERNSIDKLLANGYAYGIEIPDNNKIQGLKSRIVDGCKTVIVTTKTKTDSQTFKFTISD